MKKHGRNIIMIMSAGIGSRFGADCPKQYTYMNGRPVIDYVFDACRKSVFADEIVIVASGNYVEELRERYHTPAVQGGSSRPESVANGVRYIHENYACEKLIVTNAVCPLATTEQYDKYFGLLDEYDYVLTTWKLAPALHRFDGTRVDRDDFFNVMEPDAYRFPLLYASYDFGHLKKYIFHNMPADAKGYFCFDYPYTMKVTYSHDIPLLEALYEKIIRGPEKEKALQVINKYLSASSQNGNVAQWIRNVQNIMHEEVAPLYGITSYSMNFQTEANIVYEAQSSAYGSIIVKFTPSEFFFHKEYTYYRLAAKDTMAEMLGYDESYHMLVLKTVKPGLQVRFDPENSALRSFFDSVNDALIPEAALCGDTALPNVLSEFEEYVDSASRRTFSYQTRKILEDKCRRVYHAYFDGAPLFYLHRDLHKRNLLKDGDSIRAIDPRGAVGPREFEYVIQPVIEIRDDQAHTEERFWEMFDYFRKYVDGERYLAALFFFFVYKTNDYCFQKEDNNRLARWCLDTVRSIFFGGDGRRMNDPADLPDFRAILAAHDGGTGCIA